MPGKNSNIYKYQPKLYIMKSVIFISALVFLFSTFSQAQENKFSFKEQYDVNTPAKLKISTSDGDIQVLPGEEGTIEVFYIVYKNNSIIKTSREELENDFIIDIKHENNLLDISVRNKKQVTWKFNYDVSFKIYAPVQTSCSLASSDGDIKLSGFDADQKCRTSDGDVKIEKIKGNIDLVTSDGDIRAFGIYGDAEMETSDGDVYTEGIEGAVEIITSDGDITIKETIGAIEATTSDGDIIIKNCSGSLIASTSDGDIEGNLSKVTNKVSLVTSDGDIDISIPKGLGLDIKLKGENIKTPKLNLQGKIDENHVEGEVNGGGIPLEMITGDGTVTLSFH